jgi:penicillin-binding protein 2
MRRVKLGVSFGDFVITDAKNSRPRKMEESEERDFRRGFLIWLLILICGGILVSRMIELQLVYGGKYRQLADENRIKKIKITALRGKIVDRNGELLAKSDADGGRQYSAAEVSGHLVGYLGEIGESEVGLLRPNGGKFDVGDKVGRSGLEQKWDELLRGKDGGRLVEVNHLGEVIRNLGDVAEIAGSDLHTNLDRELMETAGKAMDRYQGAVVISNPKTGEVLGILSIPGFDTNNLSRDYSRLVSDKHRPLFNRAIGGVYPPGSTFKMVTMAAAVEDGKMSPGFTYEDLGFVTVNNYKYTSWFYTQSGRTEGRIGWEKALARSTDTFFYKVGEEIGIENIAKWARIAGYGMKTNLDIDGEVDGLVPDPAWKEKAKREKWFLGDTFIVAIGQGDLLTTPIQVNAMTNMFASKGKRCDMRIVGQGECESVNASEGTFEIVEKGMIAACSSGGTAYPFFEWNENNKDFRVACKTGTAEYVMENGKIGTHAWLTAYAPVGNPSISVTVLVEGVGEGSRTAAPVVRKIMAKYFNIEDKFDYLGYMPKGE